MTKPQQQTNSLSRWFGRVAAAVILAATAAWSGSAHAVHVVLDGNDNGMGDIPDTLSWAILQANMTGEDIQLDVNTTLSGPLLTNLNPPNPITIIGQGNSVDGGGNRMFVVDGGTVNFSDMTIQNGGVTGGAGGAGSGGGGGGLGAGGAIYVKGGSTVVIQPDVVFTGNTATGGVGGAGGAAEGGGGGGAQNGGDGANGDSTTGGAGASGDGGTGGMGGTPNSPLGDGDFGSRGAGGGGDADSGTINNPAGGAGADGAGDGGSSGVGGNGGNGAGGAIYVETNGNLVVIDNDVTANNVVGGLGGAGGGQDGLGVGSGIFVEGAAITTMSTNLTQTVSGGIGGAGQLIKDGTGTLVLTGTNNYTGGTSIRSGTLQGTTSSVVGDIANSGLVNFNQTITGTHSGDITGSGGVTITGIGVVTLAGNNTYTGGTTVSAGTLQGTTSSLTGTITNNATVTFNQTSTGTFNGQITSTGGVTISGPGTVIFAAANSYTGGTTIVGGNLQGNTTTLTGTITNNGRLIFDQAANGTYNSTLTGTGSVVKTGNGTLILSQTNTYSGGTTVLAGVLEGTTTTIQGDIVNDALVRFNQATTGTYGGSMSGSGGVNVTGGGVYVFTGTNSYSGGTTVDSGELRGTTSSLQGGILNNGEVTFNQNFTGSYAGAMSGAGAVNINGTGTVDFSGANTYTGGTTVNAGTLQGTTTSLQGDILNNANVRFVNNTTGTFNGTIAGTGGVNFTGTGTVVFDTDQTYSGNTNVQNGTLRLNASITSDVIVAAPATLGGNGFVNGDVTLGGTMAPGNSIGTMTINGNYTTSSGSVQQIEISNAGNTPGVHNDLVVVNGNVTLNGGTVSVLSNTSGGFGASKYTFLTHTGTRTGTFDSITTNSAFLNATLVYDPNAVAFIIARNATMFRDVAATFNQQQVAFYLDSNNATASNELAAVIDQLLPLDEASARTAFEMLGGAIYGSAAQANFQNMTMMYNILSRNVRNDDELGSPAFASDFADAGSLDSAIMLVGYTPDGRASIVPVQSSGMRRRRVWNAWTTSYGAGNESDDSIGFYGAGGSMVSVYRNLDEAWKFGGFGAYNYVSLRDRTPAQRVQQNNGQFGTYLRGDDGVNHLLFASSIGLDNYESSRRINFGAIDSLASGDHGGWQYSMYGEYGRQVHLWPVDLEPFVALQHAYARQNPFTETGAGILNLQVGGVDADSLRSIIGTRMLWDLMNWAGKPVRPEFHIAYIHEFLDETTAFNSVFAGVGGTSFAQTGADFGRDWGLFGGGLSFALTDRVLLAAHYDLQANERSAIHMGSATMQVRW